MIQRFLKNFLRIFSSEINLRIYRQEIYEIYKIREIISGDNQNI